MHPRDFEHGYVHVNGVRFHYARAGSGARLVLLLHGFPELWWSWRHQIGPLGRRFTVVAPDLRGYNETQKPAWGYSTDVLVHDVAELIRALGFERAVVAGHDWGGTLAWGLAITRPWRVERLITLNCPHPAIFMEQIRTNPRQLRRSWYMGFFLLPWLPELALRRHSYAFLARSLARDTRGDGTIDEQDLRIYRQALARPGALRAALAYYRQAVSPESRSMYGAGMRVDIPTLMVWGDDDAYLGTELLEGTARYVPNLRLARIPGASHWVQQQSWPIVNEVILDFLADL